ncbi:hypothetical protein GCM10007425_12510 [Lysinibacillus alkalisoli]|uniref:Phage conserved hypothetical protein C-terminal domain-containing protein n=1 Tax=Lysinibacillus alkalisoli TaxID=1911548 RepID=A0A917G357_9BACI|nr:conserved phage C-terminal domain-containing protein [Lysinibacillus alkalisoli]GGG19542.1 hypothetical protein GCM10007425_12510 [Lysinibacillus alkalisoli]
MNLLINEPPLQVLPSLANLVGLNEAIILQQLHFRLQISSNIREDYAWIYRTYDEWQVEFPFWSRDTIRRAMAKLEKQGLIITTNRFNRMKMDNTKWYRIDYVQMATLQGVQNAQMREADCTDKPMQNAQSSLGNLHRPITKEIKSNKNNTVELALDVVAYLNLKTGKNFRAQSTVTQKYIKARNNEGFILSDFKKVIDVKTKQWLNTDMQNYLRPATLFGTKFEAYLNEAPLSISADVTVPASVELNFNEGEDW